MRRASELETRNSKQRGEEDLIESVFANLVAELTRRRMRAARYFSIVPGSWRKNPLRRRRR